MVVLFIGLTTALAVGIQHFIRAKTGFSLMDFGLLFIIPVGPIILGLIGGSGIGVWAYIRGTGQKNAYLITLIAAFLGFFGSYYLKYKSHCVELPPGMTMEQYVISQMALPEGEAFSSLSENYEFKGMHISDFMSALGAEKVGFFKYLKDDVASKTISFSRKLRTVGTVSNPVVNWLFFGIDFIGFAVGGLFITAGLFQDRELYQCTACRTKRTIFPLFKIPLDEIEAVRNSLANALTGPEEFSNWAMALPFKKSSPPPLLEARATQCPKCKKGFLIMNQEIINEDGKSEKKDLLELELSVDQGKVLIGSLKGTYGGYSPPAQKETLAGTAPKMPSVPIPEIPAARVVPPPPPPRPPVRPPPPPPPPMMSS